MKTKSLVLFGATFILAACAGAKGQDVLDNSDSGIITTYNPPPVDAGKVVDNPVDAASQTDAIVTCVAESNADFCAQNSAQCGTISANDNCGAHRTVSNCGTCSATTSCVNNYCCGVETDAQFCARKLATCGSVNGLDICGVARTVANCGTCVSNGVCTTNTCCLPETDAAFCARTSGSCQVDGLKDNCGTVRASVNCGTCASPNVCLTGKCAPPNLVDHGGRVMPKTNIYVIYWGTGFASTTQSLYTSFLTGIGGSPYSTINTQYLRGEANVETYKTSYVDIITPISANITDANIHTEIDAVILGGHLPYDVDGLYFVMTPKTTVVATSFGSSCLNFCGYHDFYPGAAGQFVYAVIPSSANCPTVCGTQFFTDATSPNSNIEADEGVSVIAHELMEAQSDSNLSAWYDASGNENGDKCAYKYGITVPAGNGAPTNQGWSGKSWLVQQNWSNALHACTSN